MVDTKHRTQLWTSSGMLGPCEPRTLFSHSKYLVLQLHALNFICPLTPHHHCSSHSLSLSSDSSLSVANPVPSLLTPFPGRLRRAEQPRSLHRPRPRWKVTAITLPYENCLSSPDLRFLFFSPLFVDSRTRFLMPEWLHFLRSFLCSLI